MPLCVICLLQIAIVFSAKLYCASSPCEHGGACEEIENNYQCQCKTGYMGYNCEGKINDYILHIKLLIAVTQSSIIQFVVGFWYQIVWVIQKCHL